MKLVSIIYLSETYCLPMLLYGCEVWQISGSDKRKVNVAWNNCFRKIFNSCWHENAKPLLFFCKSVSDNTACIPVYGSMDNYFIYIKNRLQLQHSFGHHVQTTL